jgi:hypothetical protein
VVEALTSTELLMGWSAASTKSSRV